MRELETELEVMSTDSYRSLHARITTVDRMLKRVQHTGTARSLAGAPIRLQRYLATRCGRSAAFLLAAALCPLWLLL